jgi:hypothetical protein
MFKFEILDDDNTDERGILRDGHIMRTSMMARDSLSDVQKAIAATRDATQYGAATFDASLRKPGPVRDTGTTDAVAARRAAREKIYSDYDLEVQDAWRSKAPPAGSYPANGADIGSACTINGSLGTLQAIDGHDGWLQCVATDDTNKAKDSRLTRTQVSAADAAAIKEAAYQEYDRSIVDQWMSDGQRANK